MGREPYEPHSSHKRFDSREPVSLDRFLNMIPLEHAELPLIRFQMRMRPRSLRLIVSFVNGSARSLNKLVLFLPSIYIGATVGQNNQQNEIA